MDDDTLSRRNFVKGTIVVGAGVAALGSTGLKTTEAQAQNPEPRMPHPKEGLRRDAMKVREQNKAAFISKMVEEMW
jgi:hypothetical protein